MGLDRASQRAGLVKRALSLARSARKPYLRRAKLTWLHYLPDCARRSQRATHVEHHRREVIHVFAPGRSLERDGDLLQCESSKRICEVTRVFQTAKLGH